MDIKVKTTLVILFTFIIGMVAGSMLTQAFFKYRMKKVLSMRGPEGFANHFERIIDPTPEQREAVRKILYKYGKKLAEEGEKIREQFRSNHEAINKELEAILTPEQKKRLEERFFNPERDKFFRDHGDRPPPPPWMKDFPKRDKPMPFPPWPGEFRDKDKVKEIPPMENPPSKPDRRKEKSKDKNQESLKH